MAVGSEGGEIGYAVTREGTHIAYRVGGSGPPDILFIPPWMSTVELDVDDPYVGPTLRRLSSIGRVISYDKGGSGMSDAVDDAGRSVDRRLSEALGVLAAVGADRVTVLTGADGTATAIALAVEHPHLASALCLYAPFARTLRSEDYPIGFEEAEVDAMVDVASAAWGGGQGSPTAPSKADDPQFLAWFAQYQRRSASPRSARLFLRSALRTDVRDLLPDVGVPAVVVHRRGDPLVPLAFGRYVADRIPGARMIEVDGTDHFWAVGDAEPLLEALEELATGAPGASRTDRTLTTVLFTDIVGSTERATRLGDRRWKDLLETHDRLIRRELERFGGREVDTTGDGFLATFDLPSRALRCAASIQESLQVIDVRVRCGVHTGEVEVRHDGDIAGMAVHIGARVAALAGAGQVLVSTAVPPLVAGSGLTFQDLGEHDLKGVPGPWRLWSLDRRR